MKFKAVILAAGVGSRMQSNFENIPKCLVDLNGTNSISHILYCLSQCGIDEAIIVVGYKAANIRQQIGESIYNIKVTYVYNQYYNYHGCEYSLAVSAKAIEEADKIVITEGDLLMPVEYYKEFIQNKYENAVAIRNAEINPQRSVVAIGEKLVEKFVYDKEHIDVFKFIDNKKMIIGESMQLWKFGGECKNELVKLLKKFQESISCTPNLENGLYSINLLLQKYQLNPILIQGNNWINLNTIEDVQKGRSEIWLKK